MTSWSSTQAMSRTAPPQGGTGLDIDTKHPLEPLGPSHRCAPFGRSGLRCIFNRPLSTSAPLARRYAGTVFAVGREHTVKAGKVDPRFLYQGTKAGPGITSSGSKMT